MTGGQACRIITDWRQLDPAITETIRAFWLREPLVNLRPGLLAVTLATLTYAADPCSRTHGDPNGALGGTLTGFRLCDTQANATIGTLAGTTNATQSSDADVGGYAINGTGLSAQNYVFVQASDNATAFTIMPATLTFTVDPHSRYVGTPNGVIGGIVTGFRNGDTLASTTRAHRRGPRQPTNTRRLANMPFSAAVSSRKTIRLCRNPATLRRCRYRRSCRYTRWIRCEIRPAAHLRPQFRSRGDVPVDRPPGQRT